MWPRVLFTAVLSADLLVPLSVGMDLRPATLATFDRYVNLTEARMAAEVAGSSPFLWIDRQPDRERTKLMERLGRGEVVHAPLETRDGTRKIDVKGGLIHHWIGTVLLPGTPLARARRLVEEYERYPTMFGPMIQRTQVLDRTDDRFTVRMRTSMKKVITVVIDADYQIEYRQLSPQRLYTVSVAGNVFEVKNAGERDESRIPGDQSIGFLWRLNTYCSFEETTDGTVEQCESVSLTRAITFGLGWLIKPFVTGIPRETLEFTLGRVRAEAGKR